jgi:hypothetical protein
VDIYVGNNGAQIVIYTIEQLLSLRIDEAVNVFNMYLYDRALQYRESR